MLQISKPLLLQRHTLAVDHVHLTNRTWLLLTFLIPKEAVRVDLVFHTLLTDILVNFS